MVLVIVINQHLYGPTILYFKKCSQVYKAAYAPRIQQLGMPVCLGAIRPFMQRSKSFFANDFTFTFPFALLYSKQQYNIHWNNIWSPHLKNTIRDGGSTAL